MYVLLEIIRVGRMKQDPPLKRLTTNLLHRNGGSDEVFRQTLLNLLVQNADAVVDAETGVFPRRRLQAN